jgi:hypothetical protein
MKQISLATAGFQLVTKRTRKRVFLDEMNLVVPWAELVALIAPFAQSTGGQGGRPPFAVETWSNWRHRSSALSTSWACITLCPPTPRVWWK